MHNDAESLSELVDREKIRDCLARLSRGEDRRDAALLKSSYWPDATDDHGVFAGTAEKFLAWVVPGMPSIPVTLHTLGQSLIVLTGSAARVETHVTAYHRIDMAGEHRDIVIGGRYLDRLERRGQEWRIAHRIMMYDWMTDYGRSVDWESGLLGMPFLKGHSVGAAHGDHSETFFKCRSGGVFPRARAKKGRCPRCSRTCRRFACQRGPLGRPNTRSPMMLR